MNNTDRDGSFAIDLKGPIGESIFFNIPNWLMSPESRDHLGHKSIEFVKYVSALNDDRLLAVVGALVVENAIDQLSQAVFSQYKDLRDNREFTFSMKVSVLRAFCIIPAKFLRAADTIRRVRNEFAHNLDINEFSAMKQSLKDSVKLHLSQLTSSGTELTSEKARFEWLSRIASIGILTYEVNANQLKKLLRSPDFMTILQKHINPANETGT